MSYNAKFFYKAWALLLLLLCTTSAPIWANPTMAACNFSISPQTHLFPAAGGEITINLTAIGLPGDSCPWTTQDGYTWIALSRVAGNGSGTLRVSVTANQTGSERSGTVSIAGRNFTVFQAANCVSTATISNQVFNAAGGTAIINLTLNNSACSWSVSENANWITLSGSTSGLGSKQIQFTVATNAGPARQANITVTTPDKNHQFPITQYSGCKYSVIFDSLVPSQGGQYSLSVITNCEWEPVSETPWIKVPKGLHTASGTHTYTIDPNNGPQRSGTIDVEGHKITITQQSGCQFSLSPANASIGASGGTGVLTIGASNAACTWKAESHSEFLTFNNTQGQGTATVVYQVTPNQGAKRIGSATVAGRSFFLTQEPPPTPAPVLNHLSPSGATAGSASFTITVTGANFTPSARVRWNGADRTTTYVSATQLQAQIPASDVAIEGAANVTVEVPSAISNALKFSIYGALANVSAASFNGGALAPESIVAAFGTELSGQVAAANSLPLPTTLANSRVTVRDSQGLELAAPLFFVSPNQINYMMPAGLAAGSATVMVFSGTGKLSTGTIEIAPVAPGVFTANATGQGLAAAYALRVRPDGQQSYEQIAQFDQGQNAFVAMPIELSIPDEQVYLILFGTGFRHRSMLAAVTIEVGGITLTPMYASATPGLFGLDQINLSLPAGLVGQGMADLLVKVDGKPANIVKVSFK